MVKQYLVGLGGSAAKRNLHLSALRGFFDRLVNRHIVVLNPAASVKGIKETVMEGKTPEITIEQARSLLKSVDTTQVVGLRDCAIIATLTYTACRAGGGGQAASWRLPIRRCAVRPSLPGEGERVGRSRFGMTWRDFFEVLPRRGRYRGRAQGPPFLSSGRQRHDKATKPKAA